MSRVQRPLATILTTILACCLGLLASSCGDSDQSSTADTTELPVPTTSPNDGLFEDESPDAGAVPDASESGGSGESGEVALPDEATSRPSGHTWIARATNVVDGDSLDAEVEGRDVEIRLIGLNANEGGDCFGDEAGAFLRSLLGDNEFEVISPSLEPTDPAWEDDFGRGLRYLFAEGELVNYRLIVEGYAVARAQSDHPLEGLFESAEDEASAAQRGLWAPDACGTPAAEGIEILDFNANAPGPDDENRNGEWVELGNQSSQAVALAGWSVRDESTRHRYEFPSDFVLAAGDSLRLFSGASDEALSEDYDGIALYWDDPAGSVWNNGGDTILVLDPAGNIVASERYTG